MILTKLRVSLDNYIEIYYTTTCKENYFTGGELFMAQDNMQLDKLEEIVQQSILYDFYGELLSKHKRQIFEDYVLNDLSLGEIASEQGISRQGVHDIVKRCTQELKDYEEKLSLVRKFQSIKDKINYIKSIISEAEATGEIAKIGSITALADDILKEL